MNLNQLQNVRRATTSADVAHFEAYCLELGRTCHDGVAKMSPAVKEMICAAALALAQDRLNNPGGTLPPSHMKVERVARKLSLTEAVQRILAETRLKLDPETLRGLEDAPRLREKTQISVVEALEKFYARGWEWLSERVTPQRRTYGP